MYPIGGLNAYECDALRSTPRAHVHCNSLSHTLPGFELQVRSAPGLRPPSPPSPPLPTPTHSQATTHPSIKNKKHEAAGAPNLRTREADSSPGTLEATLMHIPKDQMSPSAYGEAHQDGCFEFRVASSCHAASCSPTPCLPDASPRSISEPHPSPVFASHPASISPVEPRLELPLDPGTKSIAGMYGALSCRHLLNYQMQFLNELQGRPLAMQPFQT